MAWARGSRPVGPHLRPGVAPDGRHSGAQKDPANSWGKMAPDSSALAAVPRVLRQLKPRSLDHQEAHGQSLGEPTRALAGAAPRLAIAIAPVGPWAIADGWAGRHHQGLRTLALRTRAGGEGGPQSVPRAF